MIYLEYTLIEKDYDMVIGKDQYLKIFDHKKDGSLKIIESTFCKDKIYLLVSGKQENLTRIMRGINGSFAKYLNRICNGQGRVFNQHYKYIPIDTNEKYHFYSSYISNLSQNTPKYTNLYTDILIYVIEQRISMSQLLTPKCKDDKLQRQNLIKELLIKKKYPISSIMKALKMSKSTIFRTIKCINL